MYKHTINIRVRYAETDKMGYVYYGNYATYFEVGRVELLRSLGVSYRKLEEKGVLLPVVNLNVDYKNISLSAMFETSQGNDVWNGTYGVLNYMGTHADTGALTVNNTGGQIVNADGQPVENGESFRGYIEDFGAGPVVIDSEWWTTNGGGFGDVGEPFIMDASWIKLREITLNYSFDTALIESLKISSMNLSISGRNLFTWSEIDEFDPENNLTGASRGRGLEYFSNPGTRSFITTLRIGF